MRVTSLPPPVSSYRSLRTAVLYGKEFGRRSLVDLSLNEHHVLLPGMIIINPNMLCFKG